MTIKYPIENVHALSLPQALEAFQSDTASGISQSEANKRNEQFGPNVYQAQKQKTLGEIFLHQFKSLIVYILLVGALVSFYFNDIIDALAILVVLLVNALIGFFMELQARSSMNALKEMDIIHSKVLRDGKVNDIPSEKLTPGDVIMLEAGDIIPGDGRLLEANQLQCDESSLTGESIPSEKNTEELSFDTVLGDRLNMVFKGASVINGNGKALITGIARQTELGTISALVESAEETTTPLDKKLNTLSKKLIWLTLILISVFAVTGLIQGKEWIAIIKTSIALAVAAFPEGLPIVATVALAYGMLLMGKKNAIVKKLSAVETLGSTGVILTDKTGTLTENKIYVEFLSFPEELLKVSIKDKKLEFKDGQTVKSEKNFQRIVLIGVLCNNASIKQDKLTGDPVEVALLHFAHASGVSANELKNQYERTIEVPFSSETKMMGTLHKSRDGQFAAAKGSVEDLLENCSKIQIGDSVNDLSDDNRKKILAESVGMAASGLRVLGFAFREDAALNKDNLLKNLTYTGMIGFLDPPRLDIKGAITTCRKAGIKIVMITGDHPMTALNIAKQVGLVDESEQNVLTGKDIPAMDLLSEEWKKTILSTSVFARTTPRQKLDIADVYQQAGNIVAMTGDGVNDAPALKKADVGIAMGLRGTQVAKETASIILKDDSFTSIAEAVAHGRIIFQNIQKFVVYLVSCNLSEIFIVIILGIFVPGATLLPLQILFLNMVTDVFPALALGVGKGDKTVMDLPPRDPKKLIVSNRGWIAIFLYSLAISAVVISAVVYSKQILHLSNQAVNNIAFLTLTFAQLFHVFNMASLKSKFFLNGITKNKFVWLALLICIFLLAVVYLIAPVRTTLHLVQLPEKLWIFSIIAGMIPVVMIQLAKVVFKKYLNSD